MGIGIGDRYWYCGADTRNFTGTTITIALLLVEGNKPLEPRLGIGLEARLRDTHKAPKPHLCVSSPTQRREKE